MGPLTRSQRSTWRWIIGGSVGLAVVLGVIAFLVPLEITGLIVPIAVSFAVFGVLMAVYLALQDRRR